MTENIIHDAAFQALPAPVQRYFRTCGYIGIPQRTQCRVVWSDVRMRFSPAGRWKKVHCDELLSAPEPQRVAYMTTRIAGFLPLHAKDAYEHGRGSTLVRLAGLATLQNVTAPAPATPD